MRAAACQSEGVARRKQGIKHQVAKQNFERDEKLIKTKGVSQAEFDKSMPATTTRAKANMLQASPN